MHAFNTSSPSKLKCTFIKHFLIQFFRNKGCVIFPNPSLNEHAATKAIPIVNPGMSLLSMKSGYYIIAILLLLQACGQTGPLYLPDSKAPPVYVPKQEK